MTATVLAVVAGVGLALLGLAWLISAPVTGLVGGAMFAFGALRLAADVVSRGVGR